ncbi:hypothetical protein MP228_008974 [Amoeboaphelidium protococcarum]|nr:hypothetical protein MP228_008974 [Amoeboaphelidium protococcarum]
MKPPFIESSIPEEEDALEGTDYTSIMIDSPSGDETTPKEAIDAVTCAPPVVVDPSRQVEHFSDLVELACAKQGKSTKIKKKNSQRERQKTTESTAADQDTSKSPMQSSSSESINDKSEARRRSAAAQRIEYLKKNLKNVAEMTKSVPQKLAPTRIPIVKRWIDYMTKKFPGHKKYKYILDSPWFFVYIISMSLIQAVLSAFTIDAIELADGWYVSNLVSTLFFGIYIVEVLFRIFVKGFEFFLNFYNLGEVSLTLSAFILDYQLTGTSFVANVLSLRILWVLHKIPGIKFIYEGMRSAAPRLFVILFPTCILIYVFAVIAQSTLGPQSYPFPSQDYWRAQYEYTLQNGTTIIVEGANLPDDYWGSLNKAMFTLFQVLSGDGWASDIARPTMVTRPYSFILFVVFYSVFAFVLLNIFTGVIVDSISSYEAEQQQHTKSSYSNSVSSHTHLNHKGSADWKSKSISSLNGSIRDSDETLNANPSSAPSTPPPRPIQSMHGIVKSAMMESKLELQLATLLTELKSIKEEIKIMNAKTTMKMNIMSSKITKLEGGQSSRQESKDV